MKFLHVRLKTRDLERSVAFWRDCMGCREESRKRSGRGTELVFLALPGCEGSLELAHMPWDPDFVLAEDIFHLAFEVPHVPTTVAALRAAGVKVTEEPSESRPGRWMAFVEDPDGYEIELLSGG